MPSCPSHDWDRLVREEDRQVAERAAFFQRNRDLIAVVATEIYVTIPYQERASRHQMAREHHILACVQDAADIVAAVDRECVDPNSEAY